jgi:hypothetical protein
VIPPILHGLLWLSRAALRSGRLPVRAAHGYADPAYRPPRLPFVSIVGPIAVAQDRGRDSVKPREATMLLPGHLVGSERPLPTTVPAGTLRLRFDGDATATVGVAGGPLQPEIAARQLAAQIEAALRQAAANGAFVDGEGAAISEPSRLAELALVTCRWDEGRRRLAISSGRRGLAEGLVRPVPSPGKVLPPGGAAEGVRASSVEVLGGAGSVAGALGFEGGASVAGRLKRHKLPAPRAMTVDVRVEMWASSQAELAAMTDDLARLAEVRTSFATRPALLATDAAAGDDSLELLPEGEPVTPASLVLLEAADGFADRVSNRPFAAPVGALLDSPPRFQLSGTEQMSLPVHPTPLVPGPLDAGNPAPRGVALSVGVGVGPGAAPGQLVRVCSLDLGGQPVLRLEIRFVQVDSRLLGEVTARATFTRAGIASEAITRTQVPVSDGNTPADRPFERGVVIHAAVDGSTGLVELWVDGEARAPGSEPEPEAGEGSPLGGSDMVLTVGGGPGNPLPIAVRHLHVFAEPLGAFDPRLRTSLAGGRHFVPGQRLRLATTEDGFSPGKERAETTVVAVDGDTLTVFPEVEGSWPRGRTLLFAEELFLQQVDLRRRDDLLNQLYRLSADYRIAALLESDFPEASAPLVEVPEVDVRALGATRAAGAVPGVKVVA